MRCSRSRPFECDKIVIPAAAAAPSDKTGRWQRRGYFRERKERPESARETFLRAGPASLRAGETVLRARQASLRAGETVLRARQASLRAGRTLSRAGESSLRARESSLRARQISSRAGEAASRPGGFILRTDEGRPRTNGALAGSGNVRAGIRRCHSIMLSDAPVTRIPGSDRGADGSSRAWASEVVAAGRAEVVRFTLASTAMTHERDEGQRERRQEQEPVGHDE